MAYEHMTFGLGQNISQKHAKISFELSGESKYRAADSKKPPSSNTITLHAVQAMSLKIPNRPPIQSIRGVFPERAVSIPSKLDRVDWHGS
jgi:hypothetical protein